MRIEHNARMFTDANFRRVHKSQIIGQDCEAENYKEDFVPNSNEESSHHQETWKVSRQPPPNQKSKVCFKKCVCFDCTASLLGGSSLAVILSFCLICLLAIKICLRNRDNNKTSIIIPNRQGDYSSTFKENKYFSSKDIIIIKPETTKDEAFFINPDLSRKQGPSLN